MSNDDDIRIPAVPGRDTFSLDFLNGTRGTSTCAIDAQPASFLRFGLWDESFGDGRAVLDAFEPALNFIDCDSRRFYVRVRDTAATGDRITVSLRTIYNDSGAVFDDPEKATGRLGASNITLTRMAPGVYASRGLLLVSDDDDQRSGAHHGVAAMSPQGGHIRFRGDSDWRLRRASMFGYVEAEYRGVRRRAPVFQRSPDERRRLPIHVLVVAKSSAFALPDKAMTAVWSSLEFASTIYERVGVFLETIAWPTPHPTKTVSISSSGRFHATAVQPPSSERVEIIRPFEQAAYDRGYLGAPNTIRVFIAESIIGSQGGPAAGMAEMHTGRCFVTLLKPATLAHEVGHLLMQKPIGNDKGDDAHHYRMPDTSRRRELQHLMVGGTSGGTAVGASKRLWDSPDEDGYNWLHELFVSPATKYLRPL